MTNCLEYREMTVIDKKLNSIRQKIGDVFDAPGLRLLNMLERVKDYFLHYDADREFYAKVFEGSVSDESLIRIRKMTLADLPGVLEIEGKAYRFPWTKGIFKDCLLARYDNFVLEDKEKIIGYCVLSVFVDEAHILNICIDPDQQGKGYSHRLLDHMISIAKKKSADFIMLEVRPSNKTAIALYEKWGFNEIGVRKNYYQSENGMEDAIMLAMDLTGDGLKAQED